MASNLIPLRLQARDARGPRKARDRSRNGENKEEDKGLLSGN